jgi:hypothetical protein
MQKKARQITIVLLILLLLPALSAAQTLTFKAIESQVAEYRKWLDQVGVNGSHYWVRLDSTKRPHRLYVGEGFYQATYADQENFVEIFSRFLAGHPEKNMLIDLYDPSSGKCIGEYGFGGYKLYTASNSTAPFSSPQ